jgi:hypothetical protein
MFALGSCFVIAGPLSVPFGASFAVPEGSFMAFNTEYPNPEVRQLTSKRVQPARSGQAGAWFCEHYPEVMPPHAISTSWRSPAYRSSKISGMLVTCHSYRANCHRLQSLLVRLEVVQVRSMGHYTW